MDKYMPKGIDYTNALNKQMFQFMYPMLRKRNCECGYDPDTKNQSNQKTCPIHSAFSNHISFPSLKLLPLAEEKGLYYDKNGWPKQHWCALIELHENLSKRCWSGFTIFGEKVIINLNYNEDDEEEDDDDDDDEPTTFKWSDLKQENTVAILYAEKKGDFVYESFFESDCDRSSVYVFKSGFLDLFEEAKNLLTDADTVAKGEKSSCFGCGVVCEKISRCGNCKLAKYCSVECQRKCWKESHKKLCSQNETILRLSTIPRQEFKEHFTFELNKKKSLPAYIYKQEFVTEITAKKNSNVEQVNIKPTSDTKCGLCGETNQKVFLSKGKPLTKTRCCNNWVCDDQHTYSIGSFSRNSCHRNHDRYTICSFHFNEKHSGKWQNCIVCKQQMSKVDYIDKCTNKYNFAKEKLELKNRPMIVCHNCSYKADDLDLFAGKIIRKTGETEFYCKKEECKKKGEFNGPNDSFLVSMAMK